MVLKPNVRMSCLSHKERILTNFCPHGYRVSFILVNNSISRSNVAVSVRRAILHQCIRYGNSSFTESRLYIKSIYARYSGLLLRFSLDEVRQISRYFYSLTYNYLSIIPCLSLRGVATAIARSRTLRAKVLLRESTDTMATPSLSFPASKHKER